MKPARQNQRLEMVQLTGAGARIMIWAYFVTMTTLALWTLDGVISPWPTLAAIVILAVVCVAVSRDTNDRLPLSVSVLVIVAGPVMTLLVAWQVLYFGHTQWFFGASTVGLFYLALRGRIALSWLGFLVVSACIVLWGATTEHLDTALTLAARQAPILFVGTLFAIGLRRTGNDIARVTAASSVSAIAEAAGRAAATEREQRLQELGEFATPLLEQLASGAPIAPSDRIEFAVAEAEVRDSVRARGLRLPEVIEAARSARRRGLEVVLLDDRGGEPITHAERVDLGLVVSSALVRAPDGRVTVRLLPPGRGTLATIVVDGSSYERTEVAVNDE